MKKKKKKGMTEIFQKCKQLRYWIFHNYIFETDAFSKLKFSETKLYSKITKLTRSLISRD